VAKQFVGAFSVRQPHSRVEVTRESRESSGVIPEVEVVGMTNRIFDGLALGKGADAHELVRVGKSSGRSVVQRTNQGKDRGHGTDAQRKREHGGHGEARVLG